MPPVLSRLTRSGRALRDQPFGRRTCLNVPKSSPKSSDENTKATVVLGYTPSKEEVEKAAELIRKDATKETYIYDIRVLFRIAFERNPAIVGALGVYVRQHEDTHSEDDLRKLVRWLHETYQAQARGSCIFTVHLKHWLCSLLTMGSGGRSMLMNMCGYLCSVKRDKTKSLSSVLSECALLRDPFRMAAEAGDLDACNEFLSLAHSWGIMDLEIPNISSFTRTCQEMYIGFLESSPEWRHLAYAPALIRLDANKNAPKDIVDSDVRGKDYDSGYQAQDGTYIRLRDSAIVQQYGYLWLKRFGTLLGYDPKNCAKFTDLWETYMAYSGKEHGFGWSSNGWRRCSTLFVSSSIWNNMSLAEQYAFRYKYKNQWWNLGRKGTIVITTSDDQ